jgi:hypothetical protein
MINEVLCGNYLAQWQEVQRIIEFEDCFENDIVRVITLVVLLLGEDLLEL